MEILAIPVALLVYGIYSAIRQEKRNQRQKTYNAIKSDMKYNLNMAKEYRDQKETYDADYHAKKYYSLSEEAQQMRLKYPYLK